MTATYVIYKTDTGEITSVYHGPEGTADIQCEAGESFLEASEAVCDRTFFVDVSSGAPHVVPKMPRNTAFSLSGMTVLFPALPKSTIIKVGESEVTADGVDDAVEFEVPGTHSIELSGSIKHLDETIEVYID